MNHFAHLVLSQPTVESVVGNLLGDFARGVNIADLPGPVRAGLLNHRAVDRFTDAHPLVIEMKGCFSAQRRRFAGIALDMYFDHLLIRHWGRLEQGEFRQAIDDCYHYLAQGQHLMPAEMQRVSQRIVAADWFGSYVSIDAMAEAMDRVAGRIRFPNRFDHAIDDIRAHEAQIEEGFLEFYPQLRAHISEQALES
ncbi:MAG: acyl carrier protein phosphodiesterase [Planctomycetota bacterium]|jgi:acyl carrier protein phosphodiesterase